MPPRHDERLIDLFLSGYRDRAGRGYRPSERPDQIERGKPAIDCIAVNERGDTLAIEHTLVEPFKGQRADDQPFLAVFEGLRHSTELAVPNILIDVLVPVGAVPTGIDWKKARAQVLEWFREIKLKIPIGESDYKIPGLGFDLPVHIEAMEVPNTAGGVVTGRILPKDKPFADVLRRALAAKLPELTAARANTRILLVEDASMILGFTIFSREIDAARQALPDLAQVNSVWLAHTPVWESEKIVWFLHVWPNGVQERFKIASA